MTTHTTTITIHETRASGPVVDYCETDDYESIQRVIDAERPGWTADWSSQITLADGSYRATLVLAESDEDEEAEHDPLDGLPDDEVEAIQGSWVVIADSWGDGWSEAEESALCQRATDWLTEHEGPRLSILFRPIRGSEAGGTYHVRADRTLQIHGYSLATPEVIEDLINRAWHHACEVGPRTPYTVRYEDGDEALIEALDDADANGQAEALVREGDWDTARGTVWIDVRVIDEDGGWETITVAVDPPEPKCFDEGGHDWQAPHSVLGGIEDNPGVQGNVGGVIIHEVCAHCGAYKTVDTWAQRPDTGEPGLRSVSYSPADAASLAWVASVQEAG